MFISIRGSSSNRIETEYNKAMVPGLFRATEQLCSMEPMDSSGGVSGLGTPDGGHVNFNPQVALTADVEPFFIEDLYATDLDFTQHRV